MKPGFYTADQLSNAAYHSGPGVSNSGLKLIGDKTPFHFWGRYLAPNRETHQSTKAQMIGTAIHAAALEPDKFEEEYVIAPFKDRRAAGYKAWSKEQSKHILLPGEMRNVKGMHRSLHAHKTAGALLRAAGQFEFSAYAEDPETGVLVRARYDLLLDSGWCVDLKKCQDASPTGAGKAIGNYGYFHQDAFYRDVLTWASGEEPAGFVFIFVEEEPPHAVGVYQLSIDDINRGRRLYRRNLNIYAECLQRNFWPGYSDDPVEIDLPSWDRRRIDTILNDETY